MPAVFLISSVIDTITFVGTPSDWQLGQADHHRAQAALSFVVMTLITATLALTMDSKTWAFVWFGLFGAALILFGASQIAPRQEVPRWSD